MTAAVGDVVIYTNSDGVDIPALVTGIAALATDDTPTECLHLEQFPPPRVRKDILDFEWGAPHESEVLGEKRRCWRERKNHP